MRSNKNLVFLGMMGSGKTTLGKIVSKKLNKEFIDIDQLIEIHEGMTISDIFQKKGESFFRKFEERISIQNLKKSNSVISLGGGAFINKKIQKEVLKNHISIWLKWDNKNLINRIRNSQKRPIAIQLNDIDLNQLIDDRSKIYSKAKYQIKCDRLSKLELTKKIIELNDKG
ncbi:MAG: shikimate kinase [Pelagibacteraceae bacterium TMED232]|nr:MAG: shikimate kinase [Pelagibacteraceae bacterium TMED232]|tara:strand:+ start:45 stop:557 length:513 start_codon:yes stop_codon:yes gene_type:complete